MKRTAVLWLASCAAVLAGCASAPPEIAEVAPAAVPCPKGPPEGARCLRGRDSAGAHYLIVMPAQWNQVLVVHAHGGPVLGEPTTKRADEDIARWAITVKAGYAYAASVFRQGGVAARSAAEDTERVRRIFVKHVAAPKRTILHGQSWGAAVAAKAAEMYPKSFDGVLLTSGVLGGVASYDFRLDLRAVYKYLCRNHPLPDEPQYPLWMGLPKDGKLTRPQLAARVEECLGSAKPGARRTPEQARRLKTIADVIRIPETSVLGHLNWATWHFQDIVQNRTGGRNPFGNTGVAYSGSPDDAALNAAVDRYRADAAAAATFAKDMNPTGHINVPVLTAHAVHDPIAFVELESAFRQVMEAAGSGPRLAQVFTDHNSHSYFADPEYPALFSALLAWIGNGEKPTPAGIARRCKALEASFGPGCRFVPEYQVRPLAARVPERGR